MSVVSPPLQCSVTILNPHVQQGKRRTERPWNERVHIISKTTPGNSERLVFAETRTAAYRLKNAA